MRGPQIYFKIYSLLTCHDFTLISRYKKYFCLSHVIDSALIFSFCLVLRNPKHMILMNFDDLIWIENKVVTANRVWSSHPAAPPVGKKACGWIYTLTKRVHFGTTLSVHPASLHTCRHRIIGDLILPCTLCINTKYTLNPIELTWLKIENRKFP